jgi:D-beta-D-heptose 7-phosphate kinase/D-beta-D-heptose 1-phosphate adenosyltransferase
MNETPLREILKACPGKRVLVIGDVMLDEYLWGAVRRISPEAPVPVVELQRRTYLPGGAANTAANVVGLRGEVTLAGVVGADEAGRQLRLALAERGVEGEGLVVDEGRPTTRKTRVIAHSQQVVRVDQELRAGLSAALQSRLVRFFDQRLPCVDACILSDYAKGLVSAELAGHVIASARAAGRPVVVDPKGSDFARYRGATVVKPNLHETSLFLRHEVTTLEDVLEAGQRLLNLMEADAVLITRGAAGMSLFQPGRPPVHIPAHAREVFDVTGAGDTVAATLTVALAAGAVPEAAARLASRAAAIAVGRVGTTAVQLAELLGDCGPQGR